MKKARLMVGAVLLLTSCSVVALNYVGKTYAPVAQPELFFSWSDVSRPYETMGYADAEPMNFGTIEKAQAAIEKKARDCGADAIVFVDINEPGLTLTEQVSSNAAGEQTRTVTTARNTSLRNSVLKATFIKYKE